MKFLLLVLLVGLAGCQTAPAPSVLPAPSTPPVASPPPVMPVVSGPPATSGLELKVRQQAQYIEALISQNDALTAKLAAANTASPPPATVIRSRLSPRRCRVRPGPTAAPLPLPAERL